MPRPAGAPVAPALYSRGVPPIPVRSDVAAAGPPARGALSFTPTYNDDFKGWPVAPQHRTHAVYGTFGNPTTKWPSDMPGPRVGYHQAIDILQNDASGRHPVFAIEGGTVHEATVAEILTPLKERVRSGIISIGHFRYSHVAPSVELGEKVEAGQEIGQTCLGFWHMHLEERATAGGKTVMLNPLRPGGKLAPVKDTGNPFVREMRIYAKADETSEATRSTARPCPRRRRPRRARDGLLPLPGVAGRSHRSPARLPRIDRASPGADHRPRPDALSARHGARAHLAALFPPATRRSAPIAVCIVREPKDCTGKIWIRLWERGWDTRKVPNGSYTLKLTVEDTVGRSASKTLRLQVAN